MPKERSSQVVDPGSRTWTDIARLREALDAYESWQFGDVLPRNDGEVLIPGDLLTGSDPHWARPVTEEEREAIDEVRAARELSQRSSRPARERAE